MSFRPKPLLGSTPNWNRYGMPTPVAAWIFNEGSGLKLYDSAHKNIATLNNTLPWVLSEDGKGLDFNGSVRASTNLILSNSAFTVVCSNKDAASDEGSIFGDNNGSTPYQKLCIAYGENVGETIKIYVGNGTDYDQITWAWSDYSIWHQYIFTRDGSTFDLYVDNVEVATEDTSPRTSDFTAEISPRGYSTFGGTMEYLYFFDVPLSQAQRKLIYFNPYYAFEDPYPIELFGVEAVGGYTLNAESGSYGLTGQAVGLLANRKVLAASGSYAVIGTAAALLRGYRLPAGSGSFNLAGQDVGLIKASKIPVDSGSYAITGQAVGLLKNSRIVIESGGYDITGTAVDLFHNSKIGAEAGSFILSGQNASLLKGSKIPAESGIYNITGQAAALLRGYYLGIGVGNYTLSGQDAGLIKASKIQAESGSYNLSGQAASLLRGFILELESGSYSLTGSDVALLRNAVLSAQAGAFVLTGQDADLIYTEIITIIGCLKMIISSKAPMIMVDGKQPTIEIGSKRPFVRFEETIC